ALADQLLGGQVEDLEVVGGVAQLGPLEAQPAHVLLDRADEGGVFLGRVGVVEAQVAGAAELLGDAEIQADRLGVADVQVAVGLRREPGADRGVLAAGQVLADDLADEVVARGLGGRRGGGGGRVWVMSDACRGSRRTSVAGGPGIGGPGPAGPPLSLVVWPLSPIVGTTLAKHPSRTTGIPQSALS